jgi:predicted transposase YbfD/YdcC
VAELNTIGVAIHYRQAKAAKARLASRYYILSAELNSQTYANAMRYYWEIENNLHWVLDTTMNEDTCQIYRGNAAERTKEPRISCKQWFVAMQTDYLDAILLWGCGAIVNK